MSEDTLIEFVCSHCGHTKQVKDSYLGKLAKCPACNESSVVRLPDEPPIIGTTRAGNESNFTMRAHPPVSSDSLVQDIIFGAGKSLSILAAIMFMLFAFAYAVFTIQAVSDTDEKVLAIHYISQAVSHVGSSLMCLVGYAVFVIAKRLTAGK